MIIYLQIFKLLNCYENGYLKENKFNQFVCQYVYGLAVKAIISALIILLLGAMVWVIVKSAIMLKDDWGNTIQNISMMVIGNALMVLALLEVFRTTLAYFSEERVKVTYLIDTVLVVVLSEVMVFWFKDIEYK